MLDRGFISSRIVVFWPYDFFCNDWGAAGYTPILVHRLLHFESLSKVTCHFKTSAIFWMTSDARSLSNTEEIGQSPKTPYMIFLKVCFFVVKVSYL